MDACIMWTRKDGKKTNRRYGSVIYQDKVINAHRYEWIIQKGKIPKGFYVCHKCDNGLCINIKHLFLGTPLENMLDKMRKGRHHFFNPNNTINGMRQCNKCKKIKPVNEFSTSGHSRRTKEVMYRTDCKVCRRK